MWLVVVRIGEASNPGPNHTLDDPEAFEDVEYVVMEQDAAAAVVQQESPMPPGDNTKVGPPPPADVH